MEAVDVTYATPDDLDVLAPLFDAYRQFYGQPPDLPLARRFLQRRMTLGESVILLARVTHGHEAAGFAQLFPGFSSVRANRLWILNDLFVSPSMRGQGVGRALMRRAERHAADSGAIRLTLSTAQDNRTAQALYESQGWQRDTDRHYLLPLPRAPD